MNASGGKPLSNLSVHLQSWGAMALPAKELRSGLGFGEKMDRVLSAAHIYLLCRRPAFSFRPETFSWKNERAKGNLLCRHNGKDKDFPFDLELFPEKGETAAEIAPSPCREIRMLDAKGECIRRVNAMGLSQHPSILDRDPTVNELEVLFAGNVFGEGGRPVFDRLLQNRPLMDFLPELEAAYPDDDIIVYVFEYLPYELIALPGRLGPAGTGREARFISVKANPLTEFQKICLTEAALIRYFRPAWQEKGRNCRTDDVRAALAFCETLDIAGVVLELSTVRSRFSLHTAYSAVLPHHMAMMDLTDPGERKAFFSDTL